MNIVRKIGDMMSNKKSTIFISIAVVVLFIIAIVAVSYAYYTTVVNKTGSGDVNTNTTTLSASFTDGAVVTKTNIIPGDSFSKNFTLENTGSKTLSYKIVIQEVQNTFISQSDITYVLKENDTTIATGIFPNQTSAISDVLTIEPDVTKTYTIDIAYLNTTEDQSPDMGKTISGKIFIEEV